MMKEPVEQCGGKNLVPQEVAPIGKPRVGSQQDRAVLVASGDQLKEMMRLPRRKLGVSDEAAAAPDPDKKRCPAPRPGG